MKYFPLNFNSWNCSEIKIVYTTFIFHIFDIKEFEFHKKSKYINV